MPRAGWAAVVLVVAGLLAASRLPVVRSRLEWDGRIYQTIQGAPACLTAGRYRRFVGYQATKDDSLLTGMLEQRVCVRLAPGIQVWPVRRVGWWLDGHHLVEVRVVDRDYTMVLDERTGLAPLKRDQQR